MKDQHVENKLEQLNNYTDHIQNLCKTSMDLIIDLINKEFWDSSQVEIKTERIDLTLRIKSVIDTFKVGQGLINKKFYFNASSDTIVVEADDVKLIQVINNLISNAIKFTPDNGTITVNVEEKKQAVLIKVEDNGIGIPDRFKSGLFDKYTEARRTGLKGEPSVGLGMFIINKMVELHKGKIWFESKENKGSTFYVELPIIQNQGNGSNQN